MDVSRAGTGAAPAPSLTRASRCTQASSMPRREPPRCHIVAVLTASMSHRCGSVARAAGAVVNLNASIGVSRVTGILSAAECNKAPFMYEMKGALSGHSPGSAGFPASRLRVSQSPGLTVPDRLVSQPHRPRSTGRPASLFRFVRSPGLPGATRRPPVPGTRCKFRFPGLYIVPGETPGWCPFPAVKTFLRPQPASRKSPSRFILSFFPVHILSTEFRQLSARRSGYPLPYAQLLHR